MSTTHRPWYHVLQQLVSFTTAKDTVQTLLEEALDSVKADECWSSSGLPQMIQNEIRRSIDSTEPAAKTSAAKLLGFYDLAEAVQGARKAARESSPLCASDPEALLAGLRINSSNNLSHLGSNSSGSDDDMSTPSATLAAACTCACSRVKRARWEEPLSNAATTGPTAVRSGNASSIAAVALLTSDNPPCAACSAAATAANGGSSSDGSDSDNCSSDGSALGSASAPATAAVTTGARSGCKRSAEGFAVPEQRPCTARRSTSPEPERAASPPPAWQRGPLPAPLITGNSAALLGTSHTSTSTPSAASLCTSATTDGSSAVGSKPPVAHHMWRGTLHNSSLGKPGALSHAPALLAHLAIQLPLSAATVFARRTSLSVSRVLSRSAVRLGKRSVCRTAVLPSNGHGGDSSAVQDVQLRALAARRMVALVQVAQCGLVVVPYTDAVGALRVVSFLLTLTPGQAVEDVQ